MSDGQGSGKEIKFSFVVDQASAQSVMRTLKDLTDQAEKFAKALQGAAGAMGGQGGGGSSFFGGGAVGGKAAGPASTITKNAGKGGAAGTSAITNVVLENAKAFKGMASMSGDALKSMTDILRKSVDDQKRSINDLDQTLDKLGKRYQSLREAQSKAESMAASNPNIKVSGKLKQRLKETEEELAEAASGRTKAGKDLEEMNGMLPQAGPTGFMGKARGFLNSGGGIGAQEASMATLGQVPGLGGIAKLFGGAGGLAFGGASLAATLGVAAATSQAHAAWNNQAISGQTRAEFGREGPSAYARKIRAGDLSDQRAMMDIETDQDKKREFEEIQNPGWFRRQGNRIGAFKDAFSERGFKEAFSELGAGTEGYSYQKNLREEQRKKLNMTIEERGVQEDIMADATSNASGKLALQRALGVGNGYKKGSNQSYTSNAEKLLNAFGQFDQGEVVGAVQGIAGAGQRSAAYGKNGMLNNVLQAGAAGINGAANIGGIMSRQGGNAGNNFLELLRGQTGQDVSTSALLGNYIAAQQDQMNVGGFSGSGTLGALGYGTQGDTGNMIARQNIQGMQEQQKMYSGSRDPMQKAQNFLIAQKAAPDAGYYAQQYLSTKLDANRVAEVMGNPDFELTAQERNLGITKEMITQTAQGINDSSKFRTMSKGFTKGSPQAAFSDLMAKGTSAKDAAREIYTGSKEGKWDKDSEQQAIEGYATSLAAGDQSMSWSAAMGKAREDLFGQGTNAKKGALKGDVAGGSFEAKLAKEQAGVKETDRALKDANMKTLEETALGTEAQYKRLVGVSSNLAITAETITGIIKTFADNLKKAAGGPAAANSGPNQKSKPK